MNNSWSFLREAIESLNANKLRTGLTMLGIVIGVAAVISMLSIGAGAESSITDTIEGMGTNLLFVIPDGDVTNPEPLTLSDAEAILKSDSAENVMAVAPVVSTNKEVSYSGASISASITGLTPEYTFVRNENTEAGRFISQADVDNRSTITVIGTDIVDELFDGSNTEALGSKIRIGNNLYQVVGILESSGGTAMGSSDNQVYVPITTAQTRLISRDGPQDEVDVINVSAASSDTMEAASSEVTNILKSRHGIRGDEENDFDVLSQEAFTEAASSITGVFTIFLGGIAGISLLVGGIGIMNIMLVSVTERTKEIGLRKAVGAKQRDILWQFLVEAMLMATVGGAIGLLLGAGGSFLISNFSDSLQPTLAWDSVALAIVFSATVGLFFGIYPASRAARLNPIDALRYE